MNNRQKENFIFIKENSYVFQVEKFGYLAKINCGLNPNKVNKRFRKMKCSDFWFTKDAITWKKLKSSEYIYKDGIIKLIS